MKEIDKETKRLFVETAHKIAELGLVKCSSGNLSLRLDNNTMLITATGSWMERLTEDDISVCNIADGTVLNRIQPSVEFRFHAGIYMVRSDVNAVLHFQSPYATAVACTEPCSKDFNIIPEVPYYIGSIAKVAFYPPGSEQLAKAVIEKAQNNNMIIMQNHGLVTFADDIDLLIKRAVFFELACQILFIGGDRIKSISKEQIKNMGV